MLSTGGECARCRCLAVDQLNAVWALVLMPAKTLQLGRFLAVRVSRAAFRIIRCFCAREVTLSSVPSLTIRRLPVRLLLMLMILHVVAMVTQMASVVIVVMQVAVDERVVSKLL